MGFSIKHNIRFVGFVDNNNDLLAFSRTFAFLPFFLLGYYSNNSTINKIKKCPKVISILGLVSIGSFAFIVTKYELINYKFLYMSQSYRSFDFGIFQGILLRALFYILSILVSIFVINLVSSRKFNLGKIGEKTLIIYLGHIYVIILLYKLVPTCNSTIADLCTIIVLSILTCGVLSLPIFSNIYNYVFGKINYCIDTIFIYFQKN